MGLSTRPFLLFSESRYLARDTLRGTQVTGLSRMAEEQTERLRQETLETLARLDDTTP